MPTSYTEAIRREWLAAGWAYDGLRGVLVAPVVEESDTNVSIVENVSGLPASDPTEING